jgi:hypothetical protein
MGLIIETNEKKNNRTENQLKGFIVHKKYIYKSGIEN